MRLVHAASCGLALLAVACTDAAKRPAWTAADHQHAASAHFGAADKEARLFDPEQRSSLPCPGIGLWSGNGCIQHTTNPTEAHLDAAELEKRRAAQHLAAAAALIDEEDELCKGLTLEDREQGPLMRWPRPFSAQPLVDYSGSGVFLGAVIDFAGGPPEADRLQSLVACHRARLLGRGVKTPGHDCALDDTSLSALVIATPRGTLLQLRASDPEAGQRAWERARRAAAASHARRAPRGPS